MSVPPPVRIVQLQSRWERQKTVYREGKQKGEMMIKGSMLVIMLLLASCSNSQTAAPQPQAKQQPGTALEALLSKHGQLIAKEFFELGKVRGMGGEVDLKALVISAPSGAQKSKGLKVDITGQREESAFLDVDELDALSRALAYMTDVAGKWDAQSHAPYSEVIYTSKSDLQVGFYKNASESRAFCTAGSIGAVTSFLEIDDLPKIKGFVDQAIVLLKSK